MHKDEKVGIRWACGKPGHLGGSTGPSEVESPETILHQDIVFARNGPIQVRSDVLNGIDAGKVEAIQDGDYLGFQEEKYVG
ncbi:MAG: hypothetical protein VX910_01605 [Candidatus Latescibacterota bacterium]|nr:hypothetical protein [Candidatus Latescibacterota bacterium]